MPIDQVNSVLKFVWSIGQYQPSASQYRPAAAASAALQAPSVRPSPAPSQVGHVSIWFCFLNTFRLVNSLRKVRRPIFFYTFEKVRNFETKVINTLRDNVHKGCLSVVRKDTAWFTKVSIKFSFWSL